jgi:hypothetical protein
MAERHVSFEQLSDVMAFRVTVDSVDECYRALGLVHQRWPMVPGRFKDFISTPEAQRLPIPSTPPSSTTSRCGSRSRSAPRRCTPRPSRPRRHWAYKEGKAAGDDRSIPWISDLIEILEHAGSAEELLEHTRMAMYQDRIFAFTPKGELIQLPRGRRRSTSPMPSTPILATRRSARRSTAA